MSVDILDPSSIKALQNQLKFYQDNIEPKMQSALEILANAAAEMCQSYFGRSVNVEYELDDEEPRAVITASGKAVGFLEFGAGKATDTSHEFAGNAPFDVYPGSYSEQNARMFVEHGFWIFGGRRYEFVLPKRGLYKTSNWIKDNYAKVIKGSFNNGNIN